MAVMLRPHTAGDFRNCWLPSRCDAENGVLRVELEGGGVLFASACSEGVHVVLDAPGERCYHPEGL